MLAGLAGWIGRPDVLAGSAGWLGWLAGAARIPGHSPVEGNRVLWGPHSTIQMATGNKLQATNQRYELQVMSYKLQATGGSHPPARPPVRPAFLGGHHLGARVARLLERDRRDDGRRRAAHQLLTGY